MFQKVRLNDKSEYECLVVVYRLATMLESHIAGRCAISGIGCEQGDIEHWDDIVIERSDGSFEHHQVKSQNTPFDTKSPAKPAGNPALSPLDHALNSLAKRYENPGARTEIREFTLELVASVGVKKDLEIWHLEELARQIRDGHPSSERLAERAASVKACERLYEWLTSWCGFKDWDHIISALGRLTIKTLGNAAGLRQLTRDKLTAHFVDPDAALEKILAFARATNSDISVTRPAALLAELKELLAPGCMTWTQYHFDLANDRWFVSGTTDTVQGVVEPPSAVVKALWELGNTPRLLRVPYKCAVELHNPSLGATLLRLALHLGGASRAELSNYEVWRQQANFELGGTLGISEGDVDAATWADCPHPLDQSSARHLQNPTEINAEASELSQVMDEATWRAVKEALSTRLLKITDVGYRTELRGLWTTWRQELEASPEDRSGLMTAMLYPAGERIDAERRLRLGLRTVQILACGLEMALMFALALAGSGATWKDFKKGGQTCAIALKLWSGPLSGKRIVTSIGFHGVEALIGKSDRPKYILLAGTAASPTELEKPSIVDEESTSTNMSQPALPVVFTMQIATERLRQGSAQNAQTYFRSKLEEHAVSKERAISAYRAGV